MKINNPENRWNIIPKVFSIFPIFFSLMFLHGDGLIYRAFSLIFFLLAFYTFFFTKYERYLDTEKKCTIKRIKWLFVNTSTEESIRNYESVVVSLGGTLPNSNAQSITSKMIFDVVLVRKYGSSKTHSGFGSLENFLLKNLFEDVNEACGFAKLVGDQIGLPAIVDEEIIKCLKYDPLNSAAF